MNITNKQKQDYNMALYKFILDNNNNFGIQFGGSVLFAKRVIKIIKNENLIDTFISDVSIQDNIGSEMLCLVIENQKVIQEYAGKMFFLPSKYMIRYNYGMLTIEDVEIKVVIA